MLKMIYKQLQQKPTTVSAEGNLSPSRVRTIRRIQANVVTLDRDLAETQTN